MMPGKRFPDTVQKTVIIVEYPHPQNRNRDQLLILVILASFVIGFTPGMGPMLICGVGLYGYISSCIYISVFRKYLPDETKEDAEKAGIDQFPG